VCESLWSSCTGLYSQILFDLDRERAEDGEGDAPALDQRLHGVVHLQFRFRVFVGWARNLLCVFVGWARNLGVGLMALECHTNVFWATWFQESSPCLLGLDHRGGKQLFRGVALGR